MNIYIHTYKHTLMYIIVHVHAIFFSDTDTMAPYVYHNYLLVRGRKCAAPALESPFFLWPLWFTDDSTKAAAIKSSLLPRVPQQLSHGAVGVAQRVDARPLTITNQELGEQVYETLMPRCLLW